jgi:predicted transcriptional regulator|tara:strand:- start:43 stop:501 length:459 start_codon:yes stop_codon:yes gene_type:complete
MSKLYKVYSAVSKGMGANRTGKAAKKFMDKKKKIDKSDMDKFMKTFSKHKKILRTLNKPAVQEYDKKIKSIRSSVTKGKSKSDQKEIAAASNKLNQKLYKGSIDKEKFYGDMPNLRSRFRPRPGPKRKLVKGVKNPATRNKILYEDLKKRKD